MPGFAPFGVSEAGRKQLQYQSRIASFALRTASRESISQVQHVYIDLYPDKFNIRTLLINLVLVY